MLCRHRYLELLIDTLDVRSRRKCVLISPVSFLEPVVGSMIRTYRVARNFSGSLVLRIGDFLCFAGTNFWRLGHWDWFFLLGINFYDFQKVPSTLPW